MLFLEIHTKKCIFGLEDKFLEGSEYNYIIINGFLHFEDMHGDMEKMEHEEVYKHFGVRPV